MLRVLQGRYRSKRLRLPPRDVVRPMGQRMREAVFNILQHRYGHVWSETVVLDVFAGAGTLGIESLSRGSPQAYFIESNPLVLGYLKDNIGDDCRACIMAADALSAYVVDQKAQVIFLDPPFGKNMLDVGIRRACLHADENATIVVQREREDILNVPDGWCVDAHRTYTYKVVLFVRRAG